MRVVTRRILGLGFISGLFIIAFPAFASTKPLEPCRFLGQKISYQGRLYTCISVKVKGKKALQWDSGRLIPISKPTPEVSPTAMPSPSPTSTPVTYKKIDIPLGKSSDLPTGGVKIFFAKNRYGNSSGYIVVRNSAGILAMSDICAHKGCSVEIQKEGLLCPCHNALFDPTNGDVLRGPASYPLERIPVREVDGTIFVTD